MNKLEAALKALNGKILFLSTLSAVLNDFMSDAKAVRDEAGRVLNILRDPSASMDRVTVGFVTGRAEEELDYLERLERKFLLSQAWSGECRETMINLHPQVLKSSPVSARFQNWNQLRQNGASTAELRGAYIAFSRALSRAEELSTIERSKEVLTSKPPVHIERRRHPRSESDREFRLKQKGKNPPADKHGHNKKRVSV